MKAGLWEHGEEGLILPGIVREGFIEEVTPELDLKGHSCIHQGKLKEEH